MSAHAYTEDQLVEQPAIGLFGEQSMLGNPQPDLPATLLPSPLAPGESGARPLRVREGLGVGGAQLDRYLTDT
jgi:hypothetical protein